MNQNNGKTRRTDTAGYNRSFTDVLHTTLRLQSIRQIQ